MDTNYYSEDAQNKDIEAKEDVTVDMHTASSPAELNYIPVVQRHSGPSTPLAPQKADRKPGGFASLMLVAMLLLGMLFGGAGAGAVMLVAGNNSGLSAPSSQAAGAITIGGSGTANTGSVALAAQTTGTDEATIQSIYEKVSPSVVEITSFMQASNGRFRTSGTATGTGTVLDTKGNILTNYHVIQGATSIKITLSNGTDYTATVVGTVPENDLAVINAAVPANLLVPIKLGDSSSVQIGDQVIAVGYPYDLGQSVTSGIVSGLDRDGSNSQGSATLKGLIQVDAAINPGNSGGPLLNAAGQVIGINTMIESPVEGFTGVGLAIPVNQVKSLLAQLEQTTAASLVP
ncbi:MAG: trypsin-like peptidase domain-containing protein [Chloroflexota bacterium]